MQLVSGSTGEAQGPAGMLPGCSCSGERLGSSSGVRAGRTSARGQRVCSALWRQSRASCLQSPCAGQHGIGRAGRCWSQEQLHGSKGAARSNSWCLPAGPPGSVSGCIPQPCLPLNVPRPCHAGVTIAATGGKDRVVRLWGLAPLVPSPVQKPQIATLRVSWTAVTVWLCERMSDSWVDTSFANALAAACKPTLGPTAWSVSLGLFHEAAPRLFCHPLALQGHGAPVTCLATCNGSNSSWEWADGGPGSLDCSDGGGSLLLLSGSLDARVKSWDPWTAACTGTAKLAGPVTAMAPAAAASTLQLHTLLVAAGGAVHLLDVRSMRATSVAAPPASAELHCFAQHGWDVALGGSDGARVFDLRMLDGGAGGAGSSGGSSRGAPERLRLSHGRSRPVSLAGSPA